MYIRRPFGFGSLSALSRPTCLQGREARGVGRGKADVGVHRAMRSSVRHFPTVVINLSCLLGSKVETKAPGLALVCRVGKSWRDLFGENRVSAEAMDSVVLIGWAQRALREANGQG